MKYVFAFIAGLSISIGGFSGYGETSFGWVLLSTAIVSFLASIDCMIQEAKKELLNDSK